MDLSKGPLCRPFVFLDFTNDLFFLSLFQTWSHGEKAAILCKIYRCLFITKENEISTRLSKGK